MRSMSPARTSIFSSGSFCTSTLWTSACAPRLQVLGQILASLLRFDFPICVDDLMNSVRCVDFVCSVCHYCTEDLGHDVSAGAELRLLETRRSKAVQGEVPLPGQHDL